MSETTTQSPPAAKDVRAWAKDQGIYVPARGRVPAALVEKYLAEKSGA